MSITFKANTDSTYRGAKLVLFVGDRLVTVLRDDKPDIPWPGFWDFPGGGREGSESALECALRETLEEVGIAISPDRVSWARRYKRNDHFTWFFAAHLPEDAVNDIALGDEGQCWTLMEPEEYLNNELGIPHFQTRLADYIAA